MGARSRPVPTVREGAPAAVAAVKEVLRATEQLGVEEAYARMRGPGMPRYRAMPASGDVLEEPRPFADKRRPRWG